MRDVQTSGIGPKPSIWVCTRLHWPENLVKNEVFTQSRAWFGAVLAGHAPTRTHCLNVPCLLD